MATRGSLIYFLIDQMIVIVHMYQYSLAAFNYIFSKAIDKAQPAEALGERCGRCSSRSPTALRLRHARPLRAPPPHLLAQLACSMPAGGQARPGAHRAPRAGPRDRTENPCRLARRPAGAVALRLAQLESFTRCPATSRARGSAGRSGSSTRSPRRAAARASGSASAASSGCSIIRALRPDRMTLAMPCWVQRRARRAVRRRHQLRPAALLRGRRPGDAHLLPALARRRPADGDVSCDRQAPLGKTEDDGNFIPSRWARARSPSPRRRSTRCTPRAAG